MATNPSSSSTTSKPFNGVLDPSNPLGFIETALEFVASESNLFKRDSEVKDVNSLLRLVKEKLETEEREGREKVQGNGKAEKIIKDQPKTEAPAAQIKEEITTQNEAADWKNDEEKNKKDTRDGMEDEEINHPPPHIHHQYPSKRHNSIGSVPGISPATSVHELLECPVCTNSMYPPIYQCHNGHTLCSTCKTRVNNRCPTCTQELRDIRCLAPEKVVASLELPCKFHLLGCPEIFPYDSKFKHETVCNFRPYNCPYAGLKCAVTGDIPFLVSHLRDDHKVDIHTECTFNHRYVKSNPREVKNATWMLTVFHCFGQYFCLDFEDFQLGKTHVYKAFLRFMGDEADACNYSYSLEVGGNGRKIKWKGIPRSIRGSYRKVRDSFDGLIIERNMALFFSGGDRKELKLRVTGRIWKEEQNPDAGVCIPNLCS